jgi:large subunit ribosomal protein L19
MSNIIDVIEQEQLRTDLPNFKIGDVIKVHVKVVEGAKERIQIFEGTVISKQGASVKETSWRRLSNMF